MLYSTCYRYTQVMLCNKCYILCYITHATTARELWLTSGMELATAAGFMRSAFGCGVTAGGKPRRVNVAEAELQRKAAISDARKRAADTMKLRREERGEYYYRKID